MTQLAEPFALVQVFAQQVDAQGQPIDPAPLLVGEALADANGLYSVRVGVYVQPLPPMAPPNLADGIYLITARQLDVAGNVGLSQGFGSPGTVIIDGTDANDHGFFDAATGTNQEGWLYIEKALNNIGPNVTNGSKVVVALGTTPSQTNGTGGPGGGGANTAGGAIFHAFLESVLPAQGWTLVYIDNGSFSSNTADLNNNGVNDIDEYLGGQPVTVQTYLPGADGTLGTADDVLGTLPNVRLTVTSAAIAAAPSGATEAGNTVTITTAAPHSFAVGQAVTIAGVADAGYNGTFTITGVPSPTTFTYTNATAGLAASGGGTVAAGVGTGILYVTTANNSDGDIDTAELNIINTHGADIARLVTGGGGLFSHAESTGSTFVRIANVADRRHRGGQHRDDHDHLGARPDGRPGGHDPSGWVAGRLQTGPSRSRACRAGRRSRIRARLRAWPPRAGDSC